MTAEEKVKRLWPGAAISNRLIPLWTNSFQYKVTIKPGRFCYGGTKARAWMNAWDSITQDDELSKGPRGG